MTERINLSKKKIVGFLCGVLALAMVVGSWAYYNSTNSIENKMQTAQYGNELVEKFTPKTDWQPGEEVTKESGVENTGDYDLFVRVKMSETWTLADGTTVTHPSTDPEFLTATAATSTQTNKTDGLTTGDESVVAKTLASSGWTFNQSDGYWYYNTKLAKNGGTTGNLLEKITLAGDTDMGKYTEIKYYTKAASKPLNTAIGSDPDTQWVIYTGTVPAGTTYTRTVSQLGDAGYAGAGYVLTITSETLQATKEAFDGSPTWSGAGRTPAGVRVTWGVN